MTFVQSKEDNGKIFYYLDFGHESHGRVSLRLWINVCFVEFDENKRPYVTFPVVGGKICKTEKGSFVLRRGNCTVYNILVHCGYRGGSSIKVHNKEYEKFPYSVFLSPQGSLGVSRGALFNIPHLGSIPQSIEYDWGISGRSYGEPQYGIRKIYPDASTENLEYIKNVSELDKVFLKGFV